MGDLEVGDRVIGRNGQATTVTGVYPQGVVPTYRVHLTDGTSLDCADEHLWQVENIQTGRVEVLNTLQLLASYRKGGRQARYRIPLVDPIQFDRDDHLPIPPYMLGALLGDGCLRHGISLSVGADDLHVAEKVASVSRWPMRRDLSRNTYSYRFRSDGELIDLLYALNLYGTNSYNKFIPDAYLFASPQDRLDLLRGLMDTDGSASSGRIRYVSMSRSLAEGVRFLAQSLGGTGTLHHDQATGAYIVTVRTPVNPFSMPRKAEAYDSLAKKAPYRYIQNIEKVEDVPQQCITVDASDHLYVTEHCIVTHNTCSQHWSAERIQLANQHVLYELVAEELYGEPVAGTMYNFMRITRRGGEWHTDAKRVYVSADSHARAEAYEDLAGKLGAIRSGYKSRNPGSHCSYCAMFRLCQSDYLGGDSQYLIDTYYQQRNKTDDSVEADS